MSKQHAEVLAILREASPQAARRLIGLLDSEDEQEVRHAAIAILDRVIGKPRERDDEGNPIDVPAAVLALLGIGSRPGDEE